MWIDLLPTVIQQNIAIISLLIVGFFVEKHYISRLSVFSNAIALNLYADQLPQPGTILSIYVDIGVTLGGIGLLAYLLNEELGGYYYDTTYFAYSSLAVGLVMLLPHQSLWPIFALILAGIGNALLIAVWDELAAPIA